MGKDNLLVAPKLFNVDSTKADHDQLIVVPYTENEDEAYGAEAKVKRVKKLLSAPDSTIQLHDFVIDNVKHFLASTSDDSFAAQAPYSKAELLSRISRYEQATLDLTSILSCLAYWATPAQRPVLRKGFARSTDRLELQSGLGVWLSLRWYPIILMTYCAGIAAVASDQFESLSEVFQTTTAADDGTGSSSTTLLDCISKAIVEMASSSVFKQLPGYGDKYVPMSEYLFKLLQPGLDDALFLGKTYERAFDGFEVLLALAVATRRRAQGRTAWGPIGRFGWKHARGYDSPLTKILEEAGRKKEGWHPFSAGLFTGSFQQFEDAAKVFENHIDGLGWY